MTPRLSILNAQLQLHLARAQWWTVYANTPGNLGRIVTDGGGMRYRECDLIADAMGIAETHLHNAQETIEAMMAATEADRQHEDELAKAIERDSP